MSTKKHRRQQQKLYPLLPMAIGLLLIGFAFFILTLPKSEGQAESLSSAVPVPVDFAAPELSLENINGQTESLLNYRDHVLLVNNWATWCPPCLAEMPTLAAYHSEHKSEGFTLIAIEAGDPVEVVSQFAQSHNMTFPVWLDPNGAALKAFGNGNLPNSYVIDRSGTVRYAWTGAIDRETLEKYITPLVKEN